MTPLGERNCYSHLGAEKTEAQRGQVTGPGSHSWEVAEQGSKPWFVSLQSTRFLPHQEVLENFSLTWERSQTSRPCSNILTSPPLFPFSTPLPLRREMGDFGGQSEGQFVHTLGSQPVPSVGNTKLSPRVNSRNPLSVSEQQSVITDRRSTERLDKLLQVTQQLEQGTPDSPDPKHSIPLLFSPPFHLMSLLSAAPGEDRKGLQQRPRFS